VVFHERFPAAQGLEEDYTLRRITKLWPYLVYWRIYPPTGKSFIPAFSLV
jgi:predicted component of viral defense system (DUF524 family)